MNFIKNYWDDQATRHKDSSDASWGDHWMLELEQDVLSKLIQPNSKVLDVGCANGFSTFQLYHSCHPDEMVGVDFSEHMVNEANRSKAGQQNVENLEFKVADIVDLGLPSDYFDVVYTTRVLINLPSWEQQVSGIEECFRVAKPDATVIFLEAFWEPLMLLNSMRSLCGLEFLVEHDFNRYLKKSRLEGFLKERGKSFEVDEFSSLYYLGSRLVRELATNPEDYPGYSNPINQVFFEIEKNYSCKGFGIQQAYIIQNSK